jgi:hypothetical protein
VRETRSRLLSLSQHSSFKGSFDVNTFLAGNRTALWNIQFTYCLISLILAEIIYSMNRLIISYGSENVTCSQGKCGLGAQESGSFRFF